MKFKDLLDCINKPCGTRYDELKPGTIFHAPCGWHIPEGTLCLKINDSSRSSCRSRHVVLEGPYLGESRTADYNYAIADIVGELE